MKPRVSRPLLTVLLSCLLACAGGWPVSLAADDTPPPLAASPTVTPTVAPAATAPAEASASPGASVKPAKSGKKPKAPKDPNATPKPARVKKPKEIPFVLPVGNDATHIVIPENSSTGTLLMNLMTLKATRITNELVQMDETNIDVNHDDGTENFHIALPACVFNLQTRIISSEKPVMVRTKDFELTGEKMEFNTVDRTGKLIGQVHMQIHNFKQMAGPQPPPSTP